MSWGRETRRSWTAATMAGTLLLFAPGAVASGVVAGAPDVTLDLAFGGHIEPSCSIATETEALQLDLNEDTGSHSLPFLMDCNVPVTFSVSSEGGALQHEMLERVTDTDAFQARLPYTLGFQFGADGANGFELDSEQIQQTPGAGSPGVIPFTSRGEMRLDWTAEKPLVAGRYRDVIRIHVTPEGRADHHW